MDKAELKKLIGGRYLVEVREGTNNTIRLVMDVLFTELSTSGDYIKTTNKMTGLTQWRTANDFGKPGENKQYTITEKLKNKRNRG